MRDWIARAVALGRGPIARSSIGSVGIRFLGFALSFVQGVLTARLLGANGYGTIALALSLAQIAANVTAFGFGTMAVREISARRATGDDAGIVRFSSLAVTLVFSLSLTVPLAVGIASVLGPGLPAAQWTILALASMLVPALSGITLFRGMAQGFGRVLVAQVPGEVFRPALMIMALGAIAAAGASVEPSHYLSIALGAALMTAVAGGIAVRRLLPVVTIRAAAPGERRLWLVGALPFFGMGLVVMLQGEVNTLLLGWLAGPVETGLFQPVVRLAPLVALPVQAAGIRYASRASEFWQRGETRRLQEVTFTLTWTTTVLTAAISAALVATSPWLMAIFGPEFRESAPLFWYVCAAYLFSAACGPIGLWLMMAGNAGVALVGQAAGLAVNLALGLWLIPHHGATGAAIAMATGIACGKIILLIVLRVWKGADTSLLPVLLRWRTSGSQEGA